MTGRSVKNYCSNHLVLPLKPKTGALMEVSFAQLEDSDEELDAPNT